LASSRISVARIHFAGASSHFRRRGELVRAGLRGMKNSFSSFLKVSGVAVTVALPARAADTDLVGRWTPGHSGWLLAGLVGAVAITSILRLIVASRERSRDRGRTLLPPANSTEHWF
jgi:hypothetical protein